MDGRDEVLEVVVADDHPLVAVRVRLALDLEPADAAAALQQLVDVVVDAVEVAGRERLEDDGRDAGGLQAELDLERDLRGREREQPVRGCGSESFLRPKRTSRRPIGVRG